MSDRKSPWSEDGVRRLQTALATWYSEHARPLPWRVQTSVYRTVVSEFMCQQTQIETVLPYFARWMETFPDFFALAQAPEEEVLKAWEGLGYYSRARNLQRLAQAIVTRPALPRTPAEWQALPGVGPYTAAAVTSLALGFPAAVVDGNVVRVLARLLAVEKTFSSPAEAVKTFQPAADDLLDGANPGRHNQAMMELGATVCLKARPLCLLCPVRTDCRGVRTGEPEQFPRLQRRKTENVALARIFVLGPAGLLLERAPAGAQRLAHLAELPRADHFPDLPLGPILAVKKRGISHQRITETIHDAAAADLPASLSPQQFWHPVEQLHTLTLSGPHRRWIEELLRKEE